MRQRRDRAGSYLLAAAIFLLGWQALAWLVDNPALPGPLPALAAFVRQWPGALSRHFLVSLWRVLASLVISLALAVPLGLYLGRQERLDSLLAPLVYLTYPIPKVVFLPLVMVLAGIGEAAKLTIMVLIIFFQVLVTTRDAARGVSRQSVFSLLSLGAGPWGVYRHVVIPACLPDILTATRISLGTAVAVLFFAETVAGNSGLGYFILDAWYRAEFGQMFAGILGMGLLGLGLYVVLDVAERRLCPWRLYM